MQFKQIILLVILLLGSILLQAQSQRYSLDNKETQRKRAVKTKEERQRERLTAEEKMVIRIENKQARVEKHKKKKDARMHARAVKKHNRKINGGGRNMVTGQKVYKQMRKSRREAEKNNRR